MFVTLTYKWCQRLTSTEGGREVEPPISFPISIKILGLESPPRSSYAYDGR
jgi:hypothetical protein